MSIKWEDVAMLLVLAFVLGLLLAEGSGTRSNDVIREREFIRARPDTVHTVVEIPTHPIAVHAQRNRTRTIILHDTIFKEACLDTLVTTDPTACAPDTLSICYAQHSFALSLGFAPRRKEVTIPYLAHDTFYWRADSLRTEAASSRAWYEDIMTILVAVAAGIVVGKL